MNKNWKKDFAYTWLHKIEVLRIEKEMIGKNTWRGYLHDVDKLFLYPFLNKKTVSKIHRSLSGHHTGNHKSEKDIVMALIDWESARYTKADKPKTPREYLETKIPEWTDYYAPTMKKYGLW